MLLPEIGTGLRAAGENVPEGNPGAAGTAPPAAGAVGEYPAGEPRPELAAAAGNTPRVPARVTGGGGAGDTVGDGGGSDDIELDTGDGVALAGVGVGGCSGWKSSSSSSGGGGGGVFDPGGGSDTNTVWLNAPCSSSAAAATAGAGAVAAASFASAAGGHAGGGGGGGGGNAPLMTFGVLLLWLALRRGLALCW